MEIVERLEDMGTGKLRVIEQDDGDIIIAIVHDTRKDVEFCSNGSGGGRSRHTLKALRNLIEAIKLDNEKEKK